MGKVIDLRDTGYSYAQECPPGGKVRWYDIFNKGLLGGIGDTLIWATPNGSTQGEVVDTGWENCPDPTRWVDVQVTEVATQ